MSLERSDVDKIAQLARLEIAENDVPEVARNLSNILDLVVQMDSVNTDDVEPMAHPLEMAQRLRDDVVTEKDRRDQFQTVAPQVENGLYLVPKVIE